MNRHDTTYHNLLNDILNRGEQRGDRTGTGTISMFGPQMSFDLTKGFPLLTTKKLNWNNIITELLWFLSGDTNIKALNDQGNNIWNEWADSDGNLGPVYGAMWRDWGYIDDFDGVDQIVELINGLRNNPNSRRHIVTGWDPDLLPDETKSHVENIRNDKQALPPCHTMFQFYVSKLTMRQRIDHAWGLPTTDLNVLSEYRVAGGEYLEKHLDSLKIPTQGLRCKLYQRSADMFLGVPYNIASYAALTHIIAQMCNMIPLEFIHTFGDAHIYNNHIDQVKTQLERLPNGAPNLAIRKHINLDSNIDDLKLSDFMLINYNPKDAIKAPISV